MTNEELVVLIQNGNTEYLKELYEQNKGLIRTIAERYRYLKLDREDLESICKIEMWKSIATYDVTRDSQFSSYATTFMMRGLNREIVKEKSQKRTGMVTSLNRKCSDYEGVNAVSTLQDLIVDETVINDYEAAEKRVLLSQVLNTLESIVSNERDKQIFRMRHIDGIGLEKIGSEIGTSRQNVEQICKRIVKKVKEKIVDKEIRSA